METMTINKKQAFNGREGIERFFHSVGFIWILLFITLFFWFTKETFAGIASLCVIMGIILVFCKDSVPVMTCFVFLLLIFGDREMTLTKTELLWSVVLVFPLAGFIYNIVRYKVKDFRMKGFSFATLVVLIPWLLQGIGTEGREPLRALLCVALAIAFVVVYFLIHVTTRREKGYLHYLAHVFLAVGVLIMVQVAIFHVRYKDYTFELNWIEIGWGTRNPIAAVLSLVTPVSFYFATKKSKFSWLFILLGCVEYVMILLMQSRGVTLFITIAMPFLLVYTVVRCDKKSRIGNLVVIGILLAAVAVVAVFKREIIGELFERLLSQKFSTNGRTQLWEEGIRLFIEHPIFGVGFDRRSELYAELVRVTEGPVYYHSTFIQIFAALGIVGGLAYAYFYYWRYRVAFTDMTKVKFAFVVGMLVFECYCFIDTVYFQPIGYFYLLMISLLMEKELKTEQATPNILRPIYKKLKITAQGKI